MKILVLCIRVISADLVFLELLLLPKKRCYDDIGLMHTNALKFHGAMVSMRVFCFNIMLLCNGLFTPTDSKIIYLCSNLPLLPANGTA